MCKQSVQYSVSVHGYSHMHMILLRTRFFRHSRIVKRDPGHPFAQVLA